MKHRLFKFFSLLIIIVFCFYLYGRYINTKSFKVIETPIYDKNLSPDYNGFKIAHFSDIHYGRTINETELKKIVKELNNLNADIVIFTGDLFDYKKISNQDKKLMIKYLSEIKAKLYKFAIIGDYDKLYLSDYQEILTESNFLLLNNSSKLVYYDSTTPLNFIGLTDNKSDLITNDYYNILLFHEPDLIKDIKNINLAFAGHSLGGQFKIPFIGGIRKIKGATTYIESYYKINNTELFISNGLGTQDISMRLFNSPSITLYRLYNS